jgi:hypothetical protein
MIAYTRLHWKGLKIEVSWQKVRGNCYNMKLSATKSLQKHSFIGKNDMLQVLASLNFMRLG